MVHLNAATMVRRVFHASTRCTANIRCAAMTASVRKSLTSSMTPSETRWLAKTQ
jgi:hypothetical protein